MSRRGIAGLLAAVAACKSHPHEVEPAGAPAPPSAPPPAPLVRPDAAPDAEGAVDAGDATECDPGESLEPIDKGKTVRTDELAYTLLDVRKDSVALPHGRKKKVVLVKLKVENITKTSALNLSVSQVDLARDKAKADRVDDRALVYKSDFLYPRAKLCVDLGADLRGRKLGPGEDVVGYYAFEDGGARYRKLWFSVRNVSPASVERGEFMKVAASLRVK